MLGLMVSSIITRTSLAAMGASMVLLVSACGGSSAPAAKVASLGAEGTSPSTTVAVNTQDALLKYAKCMRDNGVDMADPTFDAQGNPTGGGFGAGAQGIDRQSPAFQAAQKVCRPILRGVAFGGRNRPDRAALQAGLNEFTKCLRTEGLQVDDIQFGRGGGPGGGPDGGRGQGNGSTPTGSTPTGSTPTGSTPTGSTVAGADGQAAPPPDGGGDGPPPGGTAPDGPGFRGGNGPRPGDPGFDPTARIIERLKLDPTDPKVKAAVDKCKPILTKAFTPPSTTVAKP